MMTLRKAIFSLAILLLAAPFSLAQGTYTQIDVPGEASTQCFATDTAGDLTGLYTDSASNFHGFLFSGGTYTTIDYSGAFETELFGINDEGQVVGFAVGPSVGFLYDIQAQSFTQIQYPQAFTFPVAINNAGSIVGTIFLGDGQSAGFELVGTKYHAIKPPQSTNGNVSGISASGKLVGYVSGVSGNTLNFLYSAGGYKSLPIVGAPKNALVTGMNPSGDTFVGYYSPSTGVTSGFIYQKKGFQALQFPGSTTTYATNINSSGLVVGYFFDSSGVSHGFTWTPPAAAEKK